MLGCVAAFLVLALREYLIYTSMPTRLCCLLDNATAVLNSACFPKVGLFARGGYLLDHMTLSWRILLVERP